MFEKEKQIKGEKAKIKLLPESGEIGAPSAAVGALII
jgi:hypothetical protein